MPDEEINDTPKADLSDVDKKKALAKEYYQNNKFRWAGYHEKKLAEDSTYRVRKRVTRARWVAKNREKVRANQKRYKANNPTATLRFHYGDAALSAPPKPEVCDNCKKKPTTKRGLHFDHCHETGEFRGWLCNRCNMAAGSKREHYEFLKNLVGYLGRFYDKVA